MNSTSNSQDIILGDLTYQARISWIQVVTSQMVVSQMMRREFWWWIREHLCDDDDDDVFDDEEAGIPTPISLSGDSEFQIISKPNLSQNVLPPLPPPVDKNAGNESLATGIISDSIADEYIRSKNTVYISFDLLEPSFPFWLVTSGG